MDAISVSSVSEPVTLVPDQNGGFPSVSGKLSYTVFPSHPDAIVTSISAVVTGATVVVRHPDGTAHELTPAELVPYVGDLSFGNDLSWQFGVPGLIFPDEFTTLTYAVRVDETSTAEVTNDDGTTSTVSDSAAGTASVQFNLTYPSTSLSVGQQTQSQTIALAADSNGHLSGSTASGSLTFADSNLSTHPVPYIVKQTVTVTRLDGSQVTLSDSETQTLERGFVIQGRSTNTSTGAFDWKYDPGDAWSAPPGGANPVPFVRGGSPEVAPSFLQSDWPRTSPSPPTTPNSPASPPVTPPSTSPPTSPPSTPPPTSPPTTPPTSPPSSPTLPTLTPSTPPGGGTPPTEGVSPPSVPNPPSGLTPPSSPNPPAGGGGGTPNVNPPSNPDPTGGGSGTPSSGLNPEDVLLPGWTAVITTQVTVQDGYYSGRDSATIQVTLTDTALPLFTARSDTVDFNHLTPAQQQAILARADLYYGLGGDDDVTLPTQKNWDQALGGGTKLGWTGTAASTFYTGSKSGDTYSVEAGDSSVQPGDHRNSDKGSYFIQGGSGADTISIVSDGDNTIIGGPGTQTISIRGAGNNTVQGGSGTNDISIADIGHADISVQAGGQNSVDLSGKSTPDPAHPDEIKIGPAAQLSLRGPVQNAELNVGDGANVTVEDFVGTPSEIRFGLTGQHFILSQFTGGDVQEITGFHPTFQMDASQQNAVLLPGSPLDYSISLAFKGGDSLADTHTLIGKLTPAVAGPPTTPSVPGNPTPPNSPTPPTSPTLPSTPSHIGSDQPASVLPPTSPSATYAVLDTRMVEKAQFETNKLNEVTLTDGNLTVEMLELASEVYGPQPNSQYHLAEPLAYQKHNPDWTENVSNAAASRLWHPLSALELGMAPADFDSSKALQYSFNNGLYQAVDTNDSVVGLVDLPEANALVLTGIVNHKRTLAIVFRGTDQWADFLDYTTFQKYYAKFRPLLTSVTSYAQDATNQIEQVLVSGHSMGAAAAQYLVNDLSEAGPQPFTVECFTDGSPGAEIGKDLAIENFINTDDLVPQLGTLSSNAGFRNALTFALNRSGGAGLALAINQIQPKTRAGSIARIDSDVEGSLATYSLDFSEHNSNLYTAELAKLLKFAKDEDSPFSRSNIATAIAAGTVYSGDPVTIALGAPEDTVPKLWLQQDSDPAKVSWRSAVHVYASDNFVLGEQGGTIVWDNPIFAKVVHTVDGAGASVIKLSGLRSSYDWAPNPTTSGPEWDLYSQGILSREKIGQLYRFALNTKLIFTGWFGAGASTAPLNGIGSNANSASGGSDVVPQIGLGQAASEPDANQFVAWLDGTPLSVETVATGQTTVVVDHKLDCTDTGGGTVTVIGSGLGDVILLGTGNNTVMEQAGDNSIIVKDPAHAGNNVILAGAGNNTVVGGRGNDIIVGGSGVTTAEYSGMRSDYIIIRLPSGALQISDQRAGAPDGTDVLLSVQCQFVDKTCTFAAPVIAASDMTASHGESFAASDLFAVGDADSDLMMEYQLLDATTGTGAHFAVNGTPWDAMQLIDLNAAQFAQTTFQSGSGPDSIYVRASNGIDWSPWTGFKVVAPLDRAPVITGRNILSGHGQSMALSTLVSANDPDNDSIAQYQFYDVGAGDGQLFVSQTAQPTGALLTLSAAQFAQASYLTGSSSDTLVVRAFDGYVYSPFKIFTVTDTPPTLTAPNVVAGRGHTFALASLITATDPDGEAVAQYQLYDVGAGGGQLIVSNAAAVGQLVALTPAQFAQASYMTGMGSDTLAVRAGDGVQWSPFTIFTVTDTPPTVTAPSITAGHGRTFAASSLVSASDGDGDPVTQYQLYDVGSGGGQLIVNSTAFVGQLVTLTAAQFAQTSYTAGTGSDTLAVRANDGGQWSPFAVLTVTDTPPTVAVRSITSASGQIFAASTLVSAGDLDGDGITQYQLYDVGAGGGHLAVNGKAQAAGQLLTLSAAQFAQTTYTPVAGTDTLAVRAYDGAQWSPFAVFTVTDPDVIAPDITLELPSPYSGKLAFEGTTGTLQLDDSASFSGTVAGMTGQDTLDFRDVNFGSNPQPGYAGDRSRGKLTISDGTHSANIALLGNYMATSFTASSDGQGGTDVREAMLEPPQPLAPTQPHP